MRKKIPVEHVQIGMYVCELCGSWMDHPFWRTAFKVQDPQDLADLHSSNVREVWIDTKKGVDAPHGVHTEIAEEVEHRVDETLEQIGADTSPTSVYAPDTEIDFHRAAKLYLQSKDAVYSMFQEARMGQSINADQARKVVEDISSSVMSNPDALVSLTRIKQADEYTYMHSVAVCALMMTLARQLQLGDEEVREAGLAGLLHDLGKAGIPNEILNKPGRLTEAEFEIIKTHPELGHNKLARNNTISPLVLDVCLHHHEKMDGTGYPNGLSAENISLFAKMGAVCDVYDAITSNRPYKAGWNPAESLRKMAEWTPHHFDKNIFHAFVKSVGIYPTGSFVRLSPSERLGVVIEQNRENLLKPKVKVFYSVKAREFIMPRVIDLRESSCKETISGREEPADWNIGMHQVNQMWSGIDCRSLASKTLAGKSRA